MAAPSIAQRLRHQISPWNRERHSSLSRLVSGVTRTVNAGVAADERGLDLRSPRSHRRPSDDGPGQPACRRDADRQGGRVRRRGRCADGRRASAGGGSDVHVGGDFPPRRRPGGAALVPPAGDGKRQPDAVRDPRHRRPLVSRQLRPQRRRAAGADEPRHGCIRSARGITSRRSTTAASSATT